MWGGGGANIPNLPAQVKVGIESLSQRISNMESSDHFAALTICCMRFWGFPGGSVAHRLHLPMQETWVRSLGREDPLEKGVAIQCSILPGESHGQRNLAGYSSWITTSQTRLSTQAGMHMQP